MDIESMIGRLRDKAQEHERKMKHAGEERKRGLGGSEYLQGFYHGLMLQCLNTANDLEELLVAQ